MAEYAQLAMEGHAEAACDDHKVVFMVTAGRNGLSREFVQWVKSMQNVDRVLYSSCNRKVTQREMEWFLDGEDGEVFCPHCSLFAMCVCAASSLVLDWSWLCLCGDQQQALCSTISARSKCTLPRSIAPSLGV